MPNVHNAETYDHICKPAFRYMFLHAMSEDKLSVRKSQQKCA